MSKPLRADRFSWELPPDSDPSGNGKTLQLNLLISFIAFIDVADKFNLFSFKIKTVEMTLVSRRYSLMKL